MSASADVSVRVAWTEDAAAVAALQLRAWPRMYDGVLPPEAFPTGPEALARADASSWPWSATVSSASP